MKIKPGGLLSCVTYGAVHPGKGKPLSRGVGAAQTALCRGVLAATEHLRIIYTWQVSRSLLSSKRQEAGGRPATSAPKDALFSESWGWDIATLHKMERYNITPLHCFGVGK